MVRSRPLDVVLLILVVELLILVVVLLVLLVVLLVETPGSSAEGL